MFDPAGRTQPTGLAQDRCAQSCCRFTSFVGNERINACLVRLREATILWPQAHKTQHILAAHASFWQAVNVNTSFESVH